MRLSTIIITMIVLSCLFAKNYIIAGISLADVLIITAVAMVIIYYLNSRQSLKVGPNSYLLLYLWFLAIVGYMIKVVLTIETIDQVEFYKSFIKLSVYITCYIFIYSYVASLRREIVDTILFHVMLINAYIAIYIYIAMVSNAGLPHDFFWYGQIAPEQSVFSSGHHFIRARGLFREPAAYGVFQSLGLAYLMFNSKFTLRLSDWRLTIILISMLLTLSLSTYFLVIFIVVFIYFDKAGIIRIIAIKPVLIGVVTVMAMLTLYLVTPLGSLIEDKIFTRVERVVHWSDRSASMRLLGSWEISLNALDRDPVLGSGLGNLDVYAEKGPALAYADKSGRVHNIYAYILGSLGPLGLIVFLLLVRNVVRINLQSGIILAVSYFAYGAFLEPSYWVFLSFYAMPASLERV